MAEENKGNGIFLLALLILGGGAVWAIEKFASNTTKDTPKNKKDSSNKKDTRTTNTQTPSSGTQTTNVGNSNTTNTQTPSSGTQTPSTKDYTTNIQYSTFPTPDILARTDPNTDYQNWYVDNWIWFNKNDIFTELAKPYFNWGIYADGTSSATNWFYWTQSNDVNGFKMFADINQSYYTDATKKNLVLRVTPFTTPTANNGLTQKMIDDNLIKDIQNKTGLSLSKATIFLDKIRNNTSFDIKGYIQDNK